MRNMNFSPLPHAAVALTAVLGGLSLASCESNPTSNPDGDATIEATAQPITGLFCGISDADRAVLLFGKDVITGRVHSECNGDPAEGAGVYTLPSMESPSQGVAKLENGSTVTVFCKKTTGQPVNNDRGQASSQEATTWLRIKFNPADSQKTYPLKATEGHIPLVNMGLPKVNEVPVC